MPELDALIQKFESLQKHNFDENGILIEEQIKLSSHLWNISTLQFSPNGLFLASGSWDKTVHVWDLRTLDAPKKLDGEDKGHSSQVICLSWLPHIEFLLASGSADSSIIIWNNDTGDIMARMCEHDSWVLDLTFTSDGKYLASSAWDGAVLIWDMEMLKPICKLSGHGTAGVWACKFNSDPSSNILCTVSEDTAIRLWDMRTNTRWHSDIILSGIHNDAIKCCSWSPCNNFIVAGSRDSKISVWDVRANKAINCLHGHDSSVEKIQFLPCSSSLVFSVGGTSCCLWNAYKPQGDSICRIQQHAWSYEVEALAVSPDSTLLATGGVDRNLCLSAIEVKDSALKNLELDMNKLPYENLPVSNQNLPTVTVTGTTADVVDHAKSLTENKEKELSQQVAKQTIRITKPVTSELLQEKLLNLKNIAGPKSSTDISETFHQLTLGRSQKDQGDSIRFKSKELIAERKKLRGPPVKAKPSVKNKPVNKIPLSNMMTELQTKIPKVVMQDENNNMEDEELNIDNVAKEMINLSDEQSKM